MGRRYSGNAGAIGSGGSAPRAQAISQSVAQQSGLVASVGGAGLLAPVSYAKIGGNANLSINASTGGVSAGAAITGGTSQSLTGAATGADGCMIPFAVTLTGQAGVPAAPSLSLAAGSGQVSAAWVDGATGGSPITGHKLYRSTATGFSPSPGNLVATIAGASPYVDSGLTNGAGYFYRLTAANALGEGAPSAEAAATPASVPAAPAMSLTSGDRQVSIAWTDGSTGGSPITGHKLYRGTSAGGEVLVGTIATASPYVDSGLTNGTTYYYRLSAANAVGEGALSSSASVRPVGASAPMSAVQADGWQAVLPGAPTDLSMSPFQVVRQGFDASGAATSYTDTFYLTKRVRNPAPNETTFTPNNQAISDYVYGTDFISGVTNGSVEASPVPVCNWVMPGRGVVGNSLDVEIVAFHRNARSGRQVAAVVFTATDGTTTVSQTVAASSVSGKSYDKHAVIVYKATLDVSALATGLVTVNAKVYPWIGAAAAVADSSTGTARRGFSPRYFLKNPALAASPPYAYVAKAADAANGIGTPSAAGVVSTTLATARSTPYDTVQNALTGIQAALGTGTGIDGAIIMVGNDGGTAHVLTGSAADRTQKVAALTITRDPNVAKTNARVSFGTASFAPRLGQATGSLLTAPLTTGCLRFSDIAIIRTGMNTIPGTSGRSPLEIMFDNGCTFDNASMAATWLSNSFDYHFGTMFSGIASSTNLGQAGTTEHRIWRGVTATLNNTTMELWLMIGSTITAPNQINSGTLSSSGAVFAYNRLNSPAGSTTITIGGSGDVTGFACVQNVFEWTGGTTNGHFLFINADSATGNVTHPIIHHNTMTGVSQFGRCNIFYDEGPTARITRLQSMKANIQPSWSTKSDLFRYYNQNDTANGGNRQGNWAFNFGVGCEALFSMQRLGLGTRNFQPDYPGLYAQVGTTDASPGLDPLFVSNQATTGSGTTGVAGAGGGDYHLQAGSPARGALPVGVISHDFDGNVRPATGCAAGAYA